ncbi:hypothetical protein CA54_45060 [Symmachiella macrocystis]|uniref:DUF6817 domain-containing protein n=1 Tax=Symmachiella macrocystis TaxID=2527985 RepID=A0A5C6BDA6_9PLAN|nr:hypothetical protein [Symmachiella macrocystis]TWU09266.1 hypothetical protein CA54_45060 [Symmachiella macrocystis]
MTSPTFKQLTDYFIAAGANDVAHTKKSYIAHAIGVHNDLRAWGCSDELCRAAMFHSIYGTELFQDFTLPVEKRDEVAELIGERAERLAFWNCFMDRSTLDACAKRGTPPFIIRNRVTGEEAELSTEDFDDLCRIHLCDWLEQVARADHWDYRREAYRDFAERLGGVALESYDRVFASEPKV